MSVFDAAVPRFGVPLSPTHLPTHQLTHPIPAQDAERRCDRQEGVYSLAGRRRDFNSASGLDANSNYTKSLNAITQSSCADLIKICVINIDKRIHQTFHGSWREVQVKNERDPSSLPTTCILTLRYRQLVYLLSMFRCTVLVK